MNNEIILVNEDDNEIGTSEKNHGHKNSLLHRAVSVFIFNENKQLLMQCRSKYKYHSPNKWSNTCCGHPIPGETEKEAAIRRLDEELHIKNPNICFHSKFRYFSDVGSGMFENEITHIFIGTLDKNKHISFNTEEVSSVSWMNIYDIKKSLEENPASYTKWFSLMFNRKFDFLETGYEALSIF